MRALLAIVLALATLVTWRGPAAAQSVGDVFRAAVPSVVVIRAKGRDVGAGGQVRFNETGAGVLISADGKVMTAAHVVHAMDEITVEFVGGENVPARVVASEPAADLSLLQLDKVPANAKVAKMSNSDGIRVGDQVLIVGAPYGLSYSLSVGYISARWAPNSVYKTMPLAEFFQTDAVINTGNSGGPMFLMNGEVAGIVSHNISKGGGSEGLGFVVTMNTAKQLLLEKKSFWAGLEGQILSDQLADLLNLPPGSLGYLIKTVAKNSPAEEIGLRGGSLLSTIGGESLVLGGDILLSVGDIAVAPANLAKIREHMATAPPGSRYKVKALRAGKVLELEGVVPQ
jgi:serine protease Do